jgi:hypothetical protein
MVKLIQNMPRANDTEQYKDNNKNNITKYLEFNKDRILNLAERNYENLVEVLTNNAINTTTASSFNPIISLPQSPSTSQSHVVKAIPTEEWESFHNNEGVAD